MISWAAAISTKGAPAWMMPRAANCPALVRLVNDMTTACQVLRPAPLAMIPKVKETARYPRPMGMPSFNPDLNCVPLLSIMPPHM